MTKTAEDRGYRLAKWVSVVSWRDLPGDVKQKVKAHLIDTIGVTCAGLACADSKAMQDAVTAWGGATECTIIGRPWRANAPNAALVNAFHARIHAFDDTYETMHPGSAVVSAALACAEAAGASGDAFLAGIVAGYEIATRVCASVTPSHYDRGFHNTGTCNTIGACAAAARVFGLDADATADAFGLAGGSASGLRQYQRGGSMTDSAFNGARAAHLGVVTAQLAAAGLHGTRGILDGTFGFCNLMSDKPNLDALDRELGSHFELLGTTIKVFPTAIFTHMPIAAALQIREEHDFDPSEIDRIEIAAFSRSLDVSNRPNPSHTTEALLSHQYCIALALARGQVVLADFTGERLNDADVRELASRVELMHDAQLDAGYPAARPHRVTLRLRGDRVVTATADRPPDSDNFLLQKFRSLAEPVFGEAQTTALLHRIDHIDRMPDMTDLSSLLSNTPS